MTTETKNTPPVMSQTARNMIIGVITTVLVSGMVYLLGFNKKSNSTKLERQKATTEAWNTYITLENIYAKNLAMLLRDGPQYGGYRDLFNEFKKESDKFMGTMEGLVVTKNLDNDMLTVLKRRMENEKSSLSPTEKFYDELDIVVKRAIDEEWDMQKVTDTLTTRIKIHEQKSKGMMDRAITEIEALAKTLSDRYHQSFNVDDFYIVQVYKKKKDIFSILEENKKQIPITKDFILGKWDVSGATISWDADGKWSWFVPLDSSMAEGTWEMTNGQLIMQVPKHPKTGEKGEWTFELSDATDNSFFMKTAKGSAASYTLIRKQ